MLVTVAEGACGRLFLSLWIEIVFAIMCALLWRFKSRDCSKRKHTFFRTFVSGTPSLTAATLRTMRDSRR
jgi:hypothetical protein